MSGEHTPGPWKITDSEGMKEEYWGYDCQVGPAVLFVSYPMTDEERANAELIASAPELKAQRDELLEAAKKCEILLRYAPIIGKEDACLTELCAAIARCEGEGVGK